jgi:hypothetical protein
VDHESHEFHESRQKGNSLSVITYARIIPISDNQSHSRKTPTVPKDNSSDSSDSWSPHC